MRALTSGIALSCAVLSSALVIPIDYDVAQSPMFKYLTGDPGTANNPTHHGKHQQGQKHEGHHPSGSSWWGKLPSVDSISSSIENGIHSLEGTAAKLSDDVISVLDSDLNLEQADLTIYEQISQNKHTTKFTELINDYPDIVNLLNSTKAEHTLFVPINKAFKDIPDHHEKPSKEFIEQVLHYHIGLDSIPVKQILSSYTLPTALKEEMLGGEPQRIRSTVGFGGIKLNFYSKVVASNIAAKNGIIHAVDHILVPPTWAGAEISLFPDKFSTLLLAYDKTDFAKFIHGTKSTGCTVFAPSNKAFSRLGVKANAFLFNTEKGAKYLKALLKYQITRDTTLYSDAFYDFTKNDDATTKDLDREHYSLPTFLDGAHISVDIAKWAGFTGIRVNGFSHVVFQDAVAKNGVIQVVDRLPIPPHKHDKGESTKHEDDNIDVEDLIERLDAYIINESQ